MKRSAAGLNTIVSRHLPQASKAYAHRWFFPAAAIYAILAIPLAMLARNGYGPAALATPIGHAFEMLFGFALALIAGYLLGPMPIRNLAWLMATWLLARVVDLLAPLGWLVLASNALFIIPFAWRLLPRLSVAKKWRNRAQIPLLCLIFASAIAVILAGRFNADLQRYLLDESVLLFALLMLFMGGRILAPAVAGEFYRQGVNLEARVQPLIESGLIITVAIAFVLAPIAAAASGILLICSGLLAAIRLLRWQLWRCLARPDLVCLGVGYAWLALGLMLLGGVKLGANMHFSTAVHAITIGALGTLSLNVMVRVSLLYAKRYPSSIPQIIVMTALISIAAITRIVADFSEGRELFLAIASLVWSSAFLLALSILLGSPVRQAANITEREGREPRR
ncbi:MAG TPA: NnrS family protein [Methylophilaceae bacterium]|nr:NnrS family protein [Methylophilaceae bacterium]